VEQALARHPNSLRLQEYRDDLLKNHSSLLASREGNTLNQVQSDVSYFSDSAGNRAVRTDSDLIFILDAISQTVSASMKNPVGQPGAKGKYLSINDEGGCGWQVGSLLQGRGNRSFC